MPKWTEKELQDQARALLNDWRLDGYLSNAELRAVSLLMGAWAYSLTVRSEPVGTFDPEASSGERDTV